MKYEMLYWDGYKWFQEMTFNDLDELVKELNQHRHISININKIIENLNNGRKEYIGGHLFRLLK